MFLIAIDATTQMLVGAVIAITVPIIVAILGATLLEARRQRVIRDTERDALRKALYSEIVWNLRTIVSLTQYYTQFIPTVEQFQPGTDAPNTPSLRERLIYAIRDKIRKDVYVSAREQPQTFYQLEDAPNIVAFYEIVTAHFASKTPYYSVERLGVVLESLEIEKRASEMAMQNDLDAFTKFNPFAELIDAISVTSDPNTIAREIEDIATDAIAALDIKKLYSAVKELPQAPFKDRVKFVNDLRWQGKQAR